MPTRDIALLLLGRDALDPRLNRKLCMCAFRPLADYVDVAGVVFEWWTFKKLVGRLWRAYFVAIAKFPRTDFSYFWVWFAIGGFGDDSGGRICANFGAGFFIMNNHLGHFWGGFWRVDIILSAGVTLNALTFC